MTDKADERRINKLADAARALQEGCKTYLSVTRLTSLKSLCRDPQVARRFALYLTNLTLDKMDASCPERIDKEDWAKYRALIAQAVAGIQDNLEASRKEIVSALGDILSQITRVQNEHQRVGWNVLRRIISRHVLVAEYALHCFIYPPDTVPYWAYQTARQYAERYDPPYGTGLIPAFGPAAGGHHPLLAGGARFLGKDGCQEGAYMSKRKRPPVLTENVHPLQNSVQSPLLVLQS